MIVMRQLRAIYASLLMMSCVPVIASAAPCPPPIDAAQCVPPRVSDWWCDSNGYGPVGPVECESNPDLGLHCPVLEIPQQILSENWLALEHCTSYYDIVTEESSDPPDYFGIVRAKSRRFDVHLLPPHIPPAMDFCENATNNAQAWCDRSVICPDGYQSAGSYGIGACYRVGDKPLDPDKNLGTCPTNTGGTPKTLHPINIGMGNKYLREVDIPATSGGLKFERSYNSTNAAPNTTMGAGWQHNWDLRLNVVPMTGGVFSGTATARRSDGQVLIFTKASSSNTWLPDADVTDTLMELTTGGTLSGYQIIDGATDRVETYDLSGAVTSIDDRRTANTFTLAYDTFGRLTTVTDRSARSIEIDYDDASRIAAVWGPDVIYGDPAGPSVTYVYSGAGRLDSAAWKVGTTRQYWYEDSRYPYALTGITDENGSRYASYGYDSQARAATENLWAGPGQTAPVAQYTLTFQVNNLTHVVDPLGMQRDYQFKIVQGVAVLDNVSAPCALCGDSGATKFRTYDPVTGFTDLVTDFNGNITDYDYDSRGLEVKRVDASNDPSPPATSAKRTIESIWNPSFRVPNQRTMKNASGTIESLTAWTYNSRGQTTARCEIDPADTSGYICSATVAPSIGAKVRRWAYAYCEQADVTAGTCPQIGLLKSVNGPRLPGDMGMGGGDDTTINTYYQTDDATCSSGGTCPHRHGDLWKVTNALGQVTTEFMTYDKNGRVTRNKDANGTYTDFLYHPRGWLTDRIVRASATGTPGAGDAATHIDYDAVGNVTKVTSPDGDYLAYAYDNAHRLVKITDKLGNNIDYCPGGVGSATCLDAVGNRWVEQIKDPSNTIKRNLSRVYNQLSQLTKVFNATAQATEQSDTFDSPVNGVPLTDGYDANGNRGMVQDGLGSKTNQSFDPLNRLKNAIQNYQGTDSDPNANDVNTGYVYDTRDNLRQVTDPDGLNTVYTYDGLNNLTGLSSPDTGSSTYGYDKAGNRTSFTDNRGTLTTYSYDALNRLGTSSYPTGSLNVSYTYDQSNTTTGCTTSYPVGRLTTMTDGSGSTTYCYDRRGNVLTKKQVTNGVTFTTTYTYSVGDRLASIVYPSAMQVTYTRDNAGRINFVSYKIGTTTTTLVSAATYYPFGPLNALTFGNGRIETKKYDTNYAIDQITSSVTGGLTLDFTPDVMGDIVNVSSTIAPATPDRVYTYDPLYRLRKAQTGAAAPLEAYTYDKTGDRLSVALNGGTATTYTYTAGTHRLASVGGTTRTSDPNGNTKTGVATGFTFNYDDKNRFATAVMGLTTYTYQTNGRGERVKKAKSGGSATNTEYVYNESGQLLGDYDNTGAALNEYVYLDSQPIAVVTGGTLYYIETDHLGSPRQVINRTTNTVVWSWSLLSNTFGATAATPAGVTLNLRFPGQYADTETGLNYNYFRDYEPGTGRYVESDPVGLMAGLNTYAYVGGNPLAKSDPRGLWESADYSSCVYYDVMYSKTGCCYYSLAGKTCRGNNPVVNAWLFMPWFAPDTMQPSKLNCIRRCLVQGDQDARKSCNCSSSSGPCTNPECVDDYHNKCYKQCGISPWAYGGNLVGLRTTVQTYSLLGFCH